MSFHRTELKVTVQYVINNY